MHVSVSVELADAPDLNIPVEQTVQSGCAVVVPATSVKVPGPHLVCSVQVSVAVELVDVADLKLPGSHSTHSGSASDVPTL